MTGPALPDDPPLFDIDAELPAPGTTTLLEASAGTGKTWAIAALVARYVLEAGLPLERLLVVTFGRAASQELRSRVRERLVEADRHLEAAAAGTPLPGGDDALLRRLTDADREELLARRDRARRALTDFDAATIATIHQFCQLVLRGLGVAGDHDAGAELVEDLQQLRDEVVDDLYVAAFADNAEAPPLDRRAAAQLAKEVVSDPGAALRPRAGEVTGQELPALRVRLARQVREEMQTRKRRLGVLSYDDLLSRLADALEDPAAPARARMRARWDVVLVDEFQDTDPVQWQVFDRAFSGHAAMVLIGDPKQAIYAFRGGDITTYGLAKRTAATQATLGTNYRSDAPLVDSVVTLLGGARLGEDIVVRPVRAHCPDQRLQGAPSQAPLRLRLVNRRQFGTEKPPSIGEARLAVAEDLAQDVAALVAARPTHDDRSLRAEDIAVLCATAAQCDLVRAALVEVGVPAVVLGATSVFGSAAADDWLTLLEAMEQPHRSGRVRAAALTAFLDLTAEQLVAGGDRTTEALAETLRSWSQLLAERGVAAVFEAASSSGGMNRRLLVEQGGERLATDLRHLAQILHDVSVREQLGLPGLLSWVRAQIAETRRDTPDDRARRLDSDAMAVQILTIHKSKGLQYPVVYLPFLADHKLQQDAIPRFHDEDGARCLDVSGSPSPVHSAKAQAELADERLRLLYVAMTRAQSQLVTWWFASKQNVEASSLHRMVMGRRPGQADVPLTVSAISDEDALEAARRWEEAGALSVELVRPRTTVVELPGRAPAEVAARGWSRQLDHGWRRTSYTGLSSAAAAYEEAVQGGAAFGSEPEVTVKADEPVISVPEPETGAAGPVVRSPMADLPVGATFGSLVHAVLEHADPAAPAHGGDLRAELRDHVARQLVRWPVTVDPEQLTDALVQVLDSPLGPLAGDRTLRQIGLADRMAELDFELPLAGGDEADHPWSSARLSELAPLLREHLPDGDPLLPYAEVLEGPGHVAQELRGYLAGSVDVVLRVDDRFVVVDYKTNYLGPRTEPATELTSAHYAPDRLNAAMAHSSYPLQALLYAVVLHRFLRWRLVGYDPERHLGGVMYLYLRGMCGPGTPVVDGQPCGVFSWKPPIALVAAVSDLLDGIRRPRVTGAPR